MQQSKLLTAYAEEKYGTLNDNTAGQVSERCGIVRKMITR